MAAFTVVIAPAQSDSRSHSLPQKTNHANHIDIELLEDNTFEMHSVAKGVKNDDYVSPLVTIAVGGPYTG